MNYLKNIILNTDSYKYSQFNQYPKNTTGIFSYVEARGGKYPKTVFFGLQMFLMEYLKDPITQDMIDEAESYVLPHGLPFNREGWEYILNNHAGYLPVIIKAAPEGKVIPTRNVLLTIENTDPNCYWLTNFLETAILRALWYPTTVATASYYTKQVILEYLEKTGDPSTIDFKLHDFGSRGVSSLESSAIGGLAHLVNFQGTDNVPSLLYGRKYYEIDMAGYSIPASEHSIECSYSAIPTINISKDCSVAEV